MSQRTRASIGPVLERWSEAATRHAGSTGAFMAAVAVIVAWALLGPAFNYSDTWQLVINTGTTIITFLMVFLIQRTQNKEALALHLKLNELVAALKGASNRLIDAEDLSEKELETLQSHYRELSKLSKAQSDLTESHSVEEARARHTLKHGEEPRATARKA
jgi:low affinity Fe/Cu permease